MKNTISELVKNIEVLKDCIDEAPVDFLGTGSNSRAADNEAKQWHSDSENAYKNALSIISNIESVALTDSETPFSHEMLPELFERIEQKKSSASFDFNYTLLEAKGEVAQISYLGKNEWRIFIDNYPSTKKYYSTNFPIVTVERFMAEMKHIGLNLKLKVK